MDDEKIKQDKLRKIAEETVNKQFNHATNHLKSEDDVVHELRVHQVELEMQNEELKKAQIKLEDSRRKYFDLYSFAPNGFLTLDKKGIIIETNLKLALLLGKERHYLEKRAFIQFITPEHRNKFYHHINRVIKTKASDNIDLKIKRDDETFYTHLETKIVTDDNGNFKEFRISVTDISNLKNTEIALKESEERYKEIFFNNPTSVILIDPVNLGIIEANPSATNFYGYNHEKLLKMKISDIDTLDVYLIKEEIQRALSKKKYHYISNHILSNGKNRIVDIHTGLIPYKGENILCLVIHDVTKQKKEEKLQDEHNKNINKMLNIGIDDNQKAEVKLEELIDELDISNKEIEQFAYISSHDLKEPLRMITSFLQLLQSRYGDDLDEDANDFINYAVEGAKRLDMMINDLLEYSRVGSKEREFEYIHTEKVVNKVINNLKKIIEDKNAVVTYDPLPIIYANEYQMVQLFQNLIVNGIKYNNNIPRVHVSVEKKTNEYIFSVKDNGMGMEKSYLKKIFSIFQRLNPREKYEGTGIGLSISQRILQQHKGKIWAKSQPGNGSTFYFTIPIN
jgi:chemotaxis family two-component system sensor kinase Cph1